MLLLLCVLFAAVLCLMLALALTVWAARANRAVTRRVRIARQEEHPTFV